MNAVLSLENEIESLFISVENNFERYYELNEAHIGLQSVYDSMESTCDEDWDAQSLEMCALSVEAYSVRIGIDELTASCEDIQDTARSAANMLKRGAMAAYRGGVAVKNNEKVRSGARWLKDKLVAALKKVASAALDAFKKAFKSLTDLLAKIGDYAKNMKERAATIKKEAGVRKVGPDKDTIKISNAHKLQYRGKIDGKSIAAGLANLDKLTSAVTGPFRSSVEEGQLHIVEHFVGVKADKHLRDINFEDKGAIQEVEERFNKESAEKLMESLKSIPEDVKISGDRRIISRKKFKVSNSLPSFGPELMFLDRDTKQLKPSQVISTPDISDLKLMATHIDNIADTLVKNNEPMTKYLTEFHNKISEAFSMRLAEGKPSPSMRWSSQKITAFKIKSLSTWLASPVTDTLNAAFSSTRSAIAVCEKTLKLYHV